MTGIVKDFEAEALALVEKWARDGSLGAKRTPAGTAVFLASGPVAAALRGAYAEAADYIEMLEAEMRAAELFGGGWFSPNVDAPTKEYYRKQTALPPTKQGEPG